MTGQQQSRRTLAGWLSALLWLVVIAAFLVPIYVALQSPLLEWRDSTYILAGLSGITAMSLLLLQPLLVGGYLTSPNGLRGRRIHRRAGIGLLVAVVIHVAGLWVTSPPDVVDALLFRSPTPFSVWGVIALFTVFAAALLAAFRRKFQRNMSLWRFAHSAMAMVVATGSVIHALQIEGTMGTISKLVLCVLVMAATVWVIFDLRSWAFINRRSGNRL